MTASLRSFHTLEAARCALVLAAVLAAAGCGQPVDPAEALAAAKIEMVDAVKAARDGLKEGIPIEVELEMLKDQPVFNVELLVGDGIKVVTVDGVTGAVVATADITPSDDEKQTLAGLKLIAENERTPLASALKRAMTQLGGAKPVEVDLEDKNGVLQFDIRLLTGATFEKVTIPLAREEPAKSDKEPKSKEQAPEGTPEGGDAGQGGG